jgi:hypothetical protein
MDNKIILALLPQNFLKQIRGLPMKITPCARLFPKLKVPPVLGVVGRPVGE